jgi:O-antigen/teichoic acid export membrane protein
MSKTIARNVSANYIGIFVQIGIAFLLSPFLVHTLGDIKYGLWTIIAALSGYLSLLDMGISAAVTKFTSSYNKSGNYKALNETLKAAWALLLIACTALGILVIIGLVVIELDLISFELDSRTVKFLLVLTAIDVSLFVITGLYRGLIEGLQRFDISNIARVLAACFKALLFYSFLVNGFGLITMVVISLITNLLLLVCFQLFIRIKYNQISIRDKGVKRNQIAKVFDYSKYVFLAMIFSQILAYSGTLIIGAGVGAAAVTYFIIPWTLFEYVKQFSLAISRTFLPVFSEYDEGSQSDKIRILLLSGTRYMLIFSSLLTIGLFVLGESFINIWMGGHYGEKASLLILIFAFLQYFYSPSLICGAYLQGVSKHRFLSISTMILSIFSVLLSILLVRNYGVIGVALGSVIPQLFLYGILFPIYSCRSVGIGFGKYLKETHLKLVTPNLILIFLLYYLRDFVLYPEGYFFLFAQAILATAVYLVAVYAFTLNKDERSLINRIILMPFNKSNVNRDG